jgi:hypothetical protein
MVQAAVAEKQAAAKAVAPSVRIVGQGTMTPERGGYPFVLVSSASEPSRVHRVVYLYEGVTRVLCDCTAASYGRSCKHALVALEFLHEFERKQRDTAPVRRSNKPFSLMK